MRTFSTLVLHERHGQPAIGYRAETIDQIARGDMAEGTHGAWELRCWTLASQSPGYGVTADELVALVGSIFRMINYCLGGNGPSACPSGCLGFGSCVSVCRFDAIHVVDGVAKVDPEKCTGCLQCAAVCPRKVIVPVSYDADIVIACSNHERGAYTRRECDMGCVGCHLCEKQCEFDAIHVVNNLAVIDYSKCVSCGRCAAVCPRKLISDSNLRQDMDAVPAMPR